MKRAISLTVAAVLLSVLCCLSAFAASEQISIGAIDGAVGTIVEIPVTAKDSQKIGSLDLELTYDTSSLEYVGYENGKLFDMGVGNCAEPGLFKYAGISINGMSGDGTMFTLKMRMLDGCGKSAALSLNITGCTGTSVSKKIKPETKNGIINNIGTLNSKGEVVDSNNSVVATKNDKGEIVKTDGTVIGLPDDESAVSAVKEKTDSTDSATANDAKNKFGEGVKGDTGNNKGTDVQSSKTDVNSSLIIIITVIAVLVIGAVVVLIITSSANKKKAAAEAPANADIIGKDVEIPDYSEINNDTADAAEPTETAEESTEENKDDSAE